MPRFARVGTLAGVPVRAVCTVAVGEPLPPLWGFVQVPSVDRFGALTRICYPKRS